MYNKALYTDFITLYWGVVIVDITQLEKIHDEIASRYGDMVEDDDVDPVWAGIQQGFDMDEERTMAEET